MTEQEWTEIKERILKALESIRPYLIEDGGDVEFIDINDKKVVSVKLIGACNTCAMSINTMKLGVEQTIKRFVPEVIKVIEISE